jgi:DNA replication protein DnaC
LNSAKTSAAATTAAEQQCSYVDYLARLIDGEAALRENRGIEGRIKNARLPALKTLEGFQWSWPKNINRQRIQNLLRLGFIAAHINVVLIGNVGLGKTHLFDRSGPRRRLKGHTVLFTTVVDILNTLATTQSIAESRQVSASTDFHRCGA